MLSGSQARVWLPYRVRSANRKKKFVLVTAGSRRYYRSRRWLCAILVACPVHTRPSPTADLEELSGTPFAPLALWAGRFHEPGDVDRGLPGRIPHHLLEKQNFEAPGPAANRHGLHSKEEGGTGTARGVVDRARVAKAARVPPPVPSYLLSCVVSIHQNDLLRLAASIVGVVPPGPILSRGSGWSAAIQHCHR